MTFNRRHQKYYIKLQQQEHFSDFKFLNLKFNYLILGFLLIDFITLTN